MIATKPIDLRARLKEYFDIAFKGEPVIVSRKNNENVVIISEREYNEMQKAKRNAAYLEKLDKSHEQLAQGKTISLSVEELRKMEADDWKPTKEIKDFMEKMSHE